MKKLITILTLLFSVHPLYSQNIDECRKVVDQAISSINDGEISKLTKYLADDFKIAGQEGETAIMVLNQLFAQLGETVESSTKISQKMLGDELELVYEIDYKKMGLKEGKFRFNQKNLLKEILLFELKVKTMNSESEIQKSTKDLIEIPFEMASNLISVDVILNGTKRKFILDSGAPKVILNAAYTTKKDTLKKAISTSKGVSGTISGMDIEKVKTLDFHGIELNNQDIISMDLSHLEEKLDLSFYGLIGYEMIKDYDVLFDYENKLITLIQPDKFDAYRTENLKDFDVEVVPMSLSGHILIIEVKIGEETLKMGIDCGAEYNLIDQSFFPKVKNEIAKKRKATLSGADNIVSETRSGKIKKMTIGKETFKKQNVIFNDISHLNEGCQEISIDGLIGYPILSHQKTILSFEREEFLILKR